MKNRLFVLIFLFAWSCAGCASTGAIESSQPSIDDKTRLHYYFENDFAGFEPPTAERIMKDGYQKDFPEVTLAEVWDAVVLVLMQQGIMMHVSKDSGILVCVLQVPMGIYVPSEGEPRVYAVILEELYDPLDDSPKVLAKFKPDAQETITKAFFDSLVTEVYAGRKWEYLYSDSP